MAKMYPPEISGDTKSAAEKRYFDLIRKQLGEDWIVLHSLGLVGHHKKPWAEVDFVLIGPTGIFCLEMKGGRIARHEGVWAFTNGKEETSYKHEGPFGQVGSASAALRKHLVAKLPWISRKAVGYGVMMPDIEFRESGPDIEPNVLYDIRDADRSFSVYIRRLANYWYDRLEPGRWEPIESLSDHERSAVLDELRGDFDLRPSLKTRIGLAKNELLQLTQEQYSVLDGLIDNERVMVKGGAGTGKTLLAVEEACRRAAKGDRVFLCCFNRRLGDYLKEALKDCTQVDVYSLHSFMHKTVEEAQMLHHLPDAEPDDLFPVYYPLLCVDALRALGRSHTYDALIVDEAQDLLRDAYVDLFDELIKGGLDDGVWKLFLDPYQNIYQGVATEAMNRIHNIHPTQYRLSVNCRNTRPVAIATLLVSGVDCDMTLRVDGPEVEQEWYRDERHQQRLITNTIKRLLSDGIHPSNIVVLSRHRLDKSCLRNGLVGVPYPFVEIGDSLNRLSDKNIHFSTISAFKGLESDVVLVIDINDLEDPDILRSVYVGASRATAYLALYIDERQRDAYHAQAYNYGQKLRRQLIG